MKTLEQVFEQEFKQNVSNVGYKDIYKIPLPQECSSWNVSGRELFAVKGISEEDAPYNQLNGTIVKQLPQGTVARRRVVDKAIRGFKRDEGGNFVYEDYTVPSGSIVVVSNDNINVLYKGYKTASKSGYGYVDFVDTPNGREYMYVLPKTVLYGVNQTALALSVKNMKNFSGSGYVTWNNGVIYLHVIPYNPRATYVGSKILATKCGLDYTAEVRAVLNFWQRSKVIPDLRLTFMGNDTNLALKRTAVGYSDSEYVQIQPLALGDREIYGMGEVANGSENGHSG